MWGRREEKKGEEAKAQVKLDLTKKQKIKTQKVRQRLHNLLKLIFIYYFPCSYNSLFKLIYLMSHCNKIKEGKEKHRSVLFN